MLFKSDKYLLSTHSVLGPKRNESQELQPLPSVYGLEDSKSRNVEVPWFRRCKDHILGERRKMWENFPVRDNIGYGA